MNSLREPARILPLHRDSKAKRIARIVVCILGLRSGVARAEPVLLQSTGAYWRADPSGTIKITRGGQPRSAARIDVSDDLDLGAGNIGEGSISAEIGRHRLGLWYQPISTSGESRPSKPLVFHGASFLAGEPVRSDVDLRLIVPSYDYALIDSPSGELRAGLRAYIWTFDATLSAARSEAALHESRRFTHVLPAVTLSGSVPIIDRWALAVSTSFGIVGSNRYAIELAPELRLKLLRSWTAALGYRWLDFAFHETTNRADLIFQGPFVAISLDFNPAPP